MKFVFAFLFSILISSPTDIEGLRNGYFNAVTNKTHLHSLWKNVENCRKKDHFYYCYFSAYYSFEASFNHSLSKKLNYFTLCKKNISKRLSLKDNFDARFMRFCIQNEAPSFLGYNNNLHDDKTYILLHIKNETSQLYKTNVKAYLCKCKTLTQKEKDQVKNL